MSKRVDPIRKMKFKKARLEGKSNAVSLKEAGYSDNTAEHRVDSRNKLVKVVEKEILEDVDIRKMITIDFVLGNYIKLFKEARKPSDRRNILKDLGDYLAMFKQTLQVEGGLPPSYIVNTIISKGDKSQLAHRQ